MEHDLKVIIDICFYVIIVAGIYCIGKRISSIKDYITGFEARIVALETKVRDAVK